MKLPRCRRSKYPNIDEKEALNLCVFIYFFFYYLLWPTFFSTFICSSNPPINPKILSITNPTIRDSERSIRGYHIYSDDDSHPDGDQHFTESKPMFNDSDDDSLSCLTCNSDLFTELESEIMNFPIAYNKLASRVGLHCPYYLGSQRKRRYHCPCRLEWILISSRYSLSTDGMDLHGWTGMSFSFY